MKIKAGKEAEWARIVEINKDPYGKAVVDFADQWAVEMEQQTANKNVPIAKIAEEASRVVDLRPDFGITGAMYGMAVNLLWKCWEHGDELRDWHNAQYGRPDLKEGTVNPAIITIG